MAQIDISALDPVEAFTSTIRDLLQLTEVYKKNDAIPAIDLLRAYGAAKETFEALNFIIMTSMHAQVRDRIPPEVFEEYEQEIAARDLARLDDTSQDKINHLRRALSKFSMEFEVDEDEIPPGFGGFHGNL